jgi:hypothetical protein
VGFSGPKGNGRPAGQTGGEDRGSLEDFSSGLRPNLKRKLLLLSKHLNSYNNYD